MVTARCAKSRLGSSGQEANFVVPLADALAVLCDAQQAGTRLRGKVARPADPARE